ncbi:amino acid--tRNA ligase-related protein [Nocardioides convexus]|uniref:amino acid--tRNA ligase-related protein n=1 Tax=Nocardioides convexus TaxID=2712224 RepID=UPI002418577A|nr:amino acid--tRNA ligase-related protein [Nocardioides convexus]
MNARWSRPRGGCSPSACTRCPAGSTARSPRSLRVRQRELDLAMSDTARDHLRRRGLVLREIRESLHRQGFLEVETPVLHTVHGGANARPFVTHSNAYDLPLSLRIAPESLPQAALRRRRRAGLRARPCLPQRGRRPHPQPGVHRAGGLRRVRRLHLHAAPVPGARGGRGEGRPRRAHAGTTRRGRHRGAGRRRRRVAGGRGPRRGGGRGRRTRRLGHPARTAARDRRRPRHHRRRA